MGITGVKTKEKSKMVELISFSSFFIVLRETMEAALVVGIVLATLDKTGNSREKRQVWIGTGAAIVVSIIAAILFEVLTSGFQGDIEKLFEGIVFLSASAVLTWMIVWLSKTGGNLQHELQTKTQVAIDQDQKYAILTLVFIAVLREGIETALFLAGVRVTDVAYSAILFSGLIGVIIAILLAVLLFSGLVRVNLKYFFLVTNVILIFFAAGLFSHGLHEFQELGWLGADTLFWNEKLFSLKGVLTDSEGVGALLRALFGYQDEPSLIELLSYVLYWIGIGFLVYYLQQKYKQSEEENKKEDHDESVN